SQGSRVKSRFRRDSAPVRAVAAAVVVLVVLAGAPRAQLRLQALLPQPRVLDAQCGTSMVRDARRGNRTMAATGIADGEALSFEQDPPLVYASQIDPIAFHDFEVVGDYQTIQFRRAAADGDVLETWTRSTTRSADGRVVSIFEPSWSSA